jgi:hypothetical protein
MLILGVFIILLGFIEYKSDWFRFLKRWNGDDNARNSGMMDISTGALFMVIGIIVLLLSP